MTDSTAKSAEADIDDDEFEAGFTGGDDSEDLDLPEEEEESKVPEEGLKDEEEPADEEEQTPSEEEETEDSSEEEDDEPKEEEEQEPEQKDEGSSTEKRIRRIEGRLGDLNSQIGKLNDSLSGIADTIEKKGGDAPTDREIENASGDPEALKQLMDEYPDFKAGLESLQEQNNKTRESVGSKVDRQAFFDEMLAINGYADWKETIKDDGFQGWLSLQDDETRALYRDDRPRAGIRLLKMYEDYQKESSQPEEDDLEADIPASASRSRKPPARKKRSYDDDFDEGFDEVN